MIKVCLLRYVQPFYEDVGLFYEDVGLFYEDVGLFYEDVGLFGSDVGLFIWEVAPNDGPGMSFGRCRALL